MVFFPGATDEDHFWNYHLSTSHRRRTRPNYFCHPTSAKLEWSFLIALMRKMGEYESGNITCFSVKLEPLSMNVELLSMNVKPLSMNIEPLRLNVKPLSMKSAPSAPCGLNCKLRD